MKIGRNIYSNWIPYMVLILMFIEFPLRNILVYQEYYWGFTSNVRYAVKILEILISLPLIIRFVLVDSKDFYHNKVKREIILPLILLLSLFVPKLVYVMIHSYVSEDVFYFAYMNCKMVYYLCFYFVLGYYFSFDQLPAVLVKQVLLIGLGLILLQILVFFDAEEVSIISSTKKCWSSFHLFLGATSLFWSLICLTFFKGTYRLVVFLISIFIVFCSKGRLSLFSILVVSPFILYSSKVSVRYILLICLLSFVCISVITILTVKGYIPEHRMITAIITGTDASLNMRLEIFSSNIPDLLNNWIFGEFGGQYKYNGHSQAYMHNFLAIWRQFGIIPFILFLYLQCISIVNSIKCNKEGVLLPVCWAIITSFALLFAASYLYTFTYWFWGLSLSSILQQSSSSFKEEVRNTLGND